MVEEQNVAVVPSDEEELETIDADTEEEIPTELDLQQVEDEYQENGDKEDISVVLQNVRNLSMSAYQLYIQNVSLYPTLDTETQKDLARIVHCSDNPEEAAEARHKLIVHNLKLVIYVAKQFYISKVAFEDLVQEGNLGLIKAIDKYDYSLGYAFSTYAYWWIRQAIQRFIEEAQDIIRKPTHIIEKIRIIHKVTKVLEQELSRKPNDQEIFEYLNGMFKLKDIHKLQEIAVTDHRMLSLNAPVPNSEESDPTLFEDIISSNDGEETYTKEDQTTVINQVLQNFQPVQRRCLELRFGLNGESVRTLDETAIILYKEGFVKKPITRERARQIQKAALDRMRERYSHILEKVL